MVDPRPGWCDGVAGGVECVPACFGLKGAARSQLVVGASGFSEQAAFKFRGVRRGGWVEEVF